MPKVRVLKGWDEYNLNHDVPNLHFVFFLDNRSNDYQHIVKNQNNPDYFTLEYSNGIAVKNLTE